MHLLEILPIFYVETDVGGLLYQLESYMESRSASHQNGNSLIQKADGNGTIRYTSPALLFYSLLSTIFVTIFLSPTSPNSGETGGGCGGAGIPKYLTDLEYRSALGLQFSSILPTFYYSVYFFCLCFQLGSERHDMMTILPANRF
ncbi:hypothetical protein F4678DRAFT_224666 [Xylaria arbuscula]|nr:hypothetical protein F4678DRAFT_224666 [Xylaria arbuscula]